MHWVSIDDQLKVERRFAANSFELNGVENQVIVWKQATRNKLVLNWLHTCELLRLKASIPLG